MKKTGLLIIIFGMIGILPLTAQTDRKIVINEDIQLIPLYDSVFVHVSWHSLDNYGRFSSNGLIFIKNGEAIMVDTPMDNQKTMRLNEYLKNVMGVELTKLIIGHFHDDCLGGLEYLQSIGIESIANSKTIAKCREIGLPVPSTAFADSLIFDFNGEKIDCRFFGAGHTFDNITVWIPGPKILFGGCLVKSIDSTGLGNLSDAMVSDWDITVEAILKKYPDIKAVIPGHGDFGGTELLEHTIKLVKNEKNK